MNTSAPAPEPPIGWLESPPEAHHAASNAVRLEGWALDRSGDVRVWVERDPRPGDRRADCNARGRIELGQATMTIGARPDVARQYPQHPKLHRASWNYELRREAISGQRSFRVTVHATAVNGAGLATTLGVRHILFAAPDEAPPYLFCGRPFDSVFIEPNGDVKPYPDCRPDRAFGSLAEPGATLRTIWFGPLFTELRERIIRRDPPPMCLTCAHFINRNVDDPDYFEPR